VGIGYTLHVFREISTSVIDSYCEICQISSGLREVPKRSQYLVRSYSSSVVPHLEKYRNTTFSPVG
jgi:hypothetical protein